MSTSVEFITTTKGRPLMILEDLLYIQDRRTDTKTYWRCENHKTFNCRFRIHTCNKSVTKTHVKILKKHGNHATSCRIDCIKLSLRRFHEDIADRAKNTQETTDIVLRPTPHPKFYFCHRTSNLNETFRVDVSWAGHLVIKISA
jgi:hypothetical protein